MHAVWIRVTGIISNYKQYVDMFSIVIILLVITMALIIVIITIVI